MVSSCHACIVFVPRALRRRCALAVALHRHNSGLGTKTTRRSWTFSLHEIFKCAHLKFTLYSRKQTYIHTTSANAVTLVWGSLRLTPIKAPLKNNYDPQRRLVWSNLLLTLGGAMFRRYRIWTRLEVHLAIDCCCGCERSRNYSTTVKELHVVVLKVAQVGSKISLNRKHPSNDIYVAKDACIRAEKFFIRKGLN